MSHSQLSIVNYPLVSAIVLNYRSHRDTVRCVHALREQMIADELEILVVDNHSDDESIAFLRAQLGNMPTVRMVEERGNLGYGRSNNHVALQFARGEYLLIVNPDNVLPPDALEHMLTTLRTHPRAGIVGPALVYPDGSIRPSARMFPTFFDLVRKRIFPKQWHAEYEKVMQSMRCHTIIHVDWLVGACLLMRTDLFRSLGGFDPRFFLFFEDIDLCKRAALAGKNVLYLPQIHVLDRRMRLSGSSLFSLLRRRMTWIHAASAMKYFWKWKKA